jgi:hypothetical protein
MVEDVTPRSLGVFLVGYVHINASNMEIDRGVLIRLVLRMEDTLSRSLVAGV